MGPSVRPSLSKTKVSTHIFSAPHLTPTLVLSPSYAHTRTPCCTLSLSLSLSHKHPLHHQLMHSHPSHRDQHRAQYSYPQQLQVGVGQPGSTPMFLQGDQGMMRQGGVMDDERGLNIHNHMLPVVVNGTTSSQQTSHQYNPTVSSPMTITSNSHHNYSQTQPQQTSVQYNHHYNNNLSHNYPHGGNNNEGGNHRMISEGRNSESRNDSKQSHGQGLAPQFSNPLTPHILPSATQTAPKIFHQHFEAKVQEVVGNGVHVTSSSSTRPVSAPLEYHHHHHHHHSHTPQLPPPRAEGKPTPSNPLMTTAMLASAQTQAKLRGAGYSEYAEKVTFPSIPPFHILHTP